MGLLGTKHLDVRETGLEAEEGGRSTCRSVPELMAQCVALPEG